MLQHLTLVQLFNTFIIKITAKFHIITEVICITSEQLKYQEQFCR
jgi:hypothetical protein